VTVISITRALRVANEAGISGAEAVEVESPESPDQVISAGAEEQTAIGAFKDHQLQALSLVCDQDVDVQFLGVRYPLTDCVLIGMTITHAGAADDVIFSGDLVRVEGTVADDGIYLVDGAAPGILTISPGNQFPVGGGGAVGTFARVCSHQKMGYMYTIATATLATGVITVAGDLSDILAAGDFIAITDSTGNNGIYELLTVVGIAGLTTLTVVGAALEDNTDDGQLYKVRPAIELSANEPFLWSYESGIQNPFIHPTTNEGLDHQGASPIYNVDRGDVAYCMVNNPGAVNANFDARICKNAIIF